MPIVFFGSNKIAPQVIKVELNRKPYLGCGYCAERRQKAVVEDMPEYSKKGYISDSSDYIVVNLVGNYLHSNHKMRKKNSIRFLIL